MKKYTIIGTDSGGETYFECVESTSVKQALIDAFMPSEEGEAPPSIVNAVLEGHHKEVGLSAHGFVYPIGENDAFEGIF